MKREWIEPSVTKLDIKVTEGHGQCGCNPNPGNFWNHIKFGKS